MASLVTSPSAPHVGEVVTLGVDDSRASAVRWELVSRPLRSALALGTLLDARGAWSSTLTPDAPGTYGVTAYAYERRSGIPARYPGDPAAEPRDVLLGAHALALRVAARLSLPVATPLGGAVLTLSVRDLFRGGGDMVGTQDEVLAAEWQAPTTEAARVALLASEVVTATAALVGSSVPALDMELVDAVAELRAAYEAHRMTVRAASEDEEDDAESATVHEQADPEHVVRGGQPYAVSRALDLVPALRAALEGHLASAGTDGAHVEADARNAPLALPGAGIASTYVEAVDLRHRVYARHLEQVAEPASHGTSDTAHAIEAAMPLAAAIVAFLDALASRSPQLPATESQGAATAGARFGFQPRRA